MTTPGSRVGADRLLGLDREREVLTVAVRAGRHVVIEGPPGVGKSTLLRTIAAELGTAVVFVEGNAELTPARLIGSHDPAQVLREGYLPEAFVDGPLLAAMRRGALLYLEELNRVPEETMNVLITVLTEGEIAVPRLGAVQAAAGFRLIAAMNPFDAIGTARVGQAIADRICRVVLGYADEQAERAITAQQAVPAGQTAADGALVDLAVRLTRSTREHPDLRTGSSVRGSIDLVLLLDGLLRLRNGAGPVVLGVPPPLETLQDAARAALSGRVRVADGCERTAESVLDELIAQLLAGPGKADRPSPSAAGGSPTHSRSALRRDRHSGPGRRQAGRAELAARHPGFAQVSPGVGELDTDALAGLLATDPEAATTLLADLTLATDRALRAAATTLATRVFVRLGRTIGQRTRGTRRLIPNRRGDGDLDLDRTLDRWADTISPDSSTPGPDDLVTRGWSARRRAVCLLVDRSGSMSGLAVTLAAVSAAAVAQSGDGLLRPAVLAFGSEVSVLQEAGGRRPVEQLVGDLIRLRGHGDTDLAAGLRAASAALSAAAPGADERIVLLLSDCRPTAGAEPATALAGIDRLHVLYPLPADRADGPDRADRANRANDEAMAVALARRGGGLARPVRSLADLPAALLVLLG